MAGSWAPGFLESYPSGPAGRPRKPEMAAGCEPLADCATGRETGISYTGPKTAPQEIAPLHSPSRLKTGLRLNHRSAREGPATVQGVDATCFRTGFLRWNTDHGQSAIYRQGYTDSWRDPPSRRQTLESRCLGNQGPRAAHENAPPTLDLLCKVNSIQSGCAPRDVSRASRWAITGIAFGLGRASRVDPEVALRYE
jgi:hypothetical protein